MKNFLVVYFLFFLSLFYFPQERLGITNSNYSSTNSIFLNPVSSVDSKVFMQLNLLGLNTFAMSNIVYFPDINFYSFISLATNTAAPQISPEISTINFKKYIYSSSEVNALSFMMSHRDYGGGFFIRVRNVTDVLNVSNELIEYAVNKYKKLSVKDINYQSIDIHLSSLTWAEYGINFGKIIKKKRGELISVGGNLKYLTGINLAYLNFTGLEGKIRNQENKTDLLIGQVRMNLPSWNNGWGIGSDFGFSYKRMLKQVDNYNVHSSLSDCKSIDYKFKLAASLRDLGYIRFTENTYSTDYDVLGNTKNREDSSWQKIDKFDFLGACKTSEVITATLPTALSVQFDYNFENNFYLTGTIIKNIVPLSFVGVQGANLISFAPRYETKNYEVAMPLTLQRFLYPQLGLTFRVRSFVLGFDNLFPLFIAKDTYGLNVYFSLAISLFKNPSCNEKLNINKIKIFKAPVKL